MAQLNPAQQAAVDHGLGPLLVLAGAGSGKTRVITERIAQLIKRGSRPEQILAVSFTNKSSAEMAERMMPLIGREKTKRLWLSTFHSFGVRFLQKENRALGYDGRFVIFDQGDTLGLVRDIMRREGIGDRTLDTMSILTRISLWKNAFKLPEDIPATDYEYDDVARDVYPHYQADLRRMHGCDFDDLVVAPVQILKKRPDIREKWQARFRHLLIDEFQDTNKSQLELVKLLASDLGNVCVVGDDDQSIYGWRGAEVENILDFERTFKGAKVVMLEENYRSRTPIIDVANAVISQTKGKRHEKVLRATRGPGDRVRLVTVRDAAAQAKMIVSEIRHMVEDKFRHKDIAVLYRSNLAARLLEEEFRVDGVPYRLYGGTQFYDRKEIKDAIAYLRVVTSARDDLALRRIVNHPPRGLGDASLAKTHTFGLLRGMTLQESLAHADEIEGVSEMARRGARSLMGSLDKARAGFRSGALVETTRQLLDDVGFHGGLGDSSSKDARRRVENINFLLKSLAKHENDRSADRPSLSQFLTRITLRFDNDDEDTGNRVTLSSLHSSKGLEFPVVFLINCVEGVMPHKRTIDPKVSEAAPTDVEEERRLFYVGVTRAKERLYLCRPLQKSFRGQVVPQIPTRFLDGIPADATEEYEPVGQQEMGVEEAGDFAAQILASLASSD